MTVDWVWISLLALWQRWWPDRPGLELLDDKMQAGYTQDAEHDTHAAVVTWLDAWSTCCGCAKRLAGALGRGFTTVRDPGGARRGPGPGDPGRPDGGAQVPVLRARAEPDRRPWRSAAAGAGCFLGGGHMAEAVDGVDALRRAARERLRSGAHAIKIMASGGVISPSDPLRVPQYSPEEIRVVAEEAARRGSYVAAHAYSAAVIQVAVANGVGCHRARAR